MLLIILLQPNITTFTLVGVFFSIFSKKQLKNKSWSVKCFPHLRGFWLIIQMISHHLLPMFYLHFLHLP